MPEAGKVNPSKTDTVREAVGVFGDAETLDDAIEELLVAGFDRAEISLLAGEKAVVEKLGHRYQRVRELEDDPNVARAAYVEKDSIVEGRAGMVGGMAYVGALAAVGVIVASGGTLGAAILGATLAGGGGGLLGTVVAGWLSRRHADHIEEQLKKGGLLLWVHIKDDEHEKRARKILETHSAADVHVHDMPKSRMSEKNPLRDVNIDPFLPGAPI
jgi:hypothetical protein